MRFSITPSSLRASLPFDAECKRQKIDLPNGLPNDWIFQWFELHLRSEHVLDGGRYDGELQMMHLGTEGQMREVAIVSVLLDASSIRDEPKIQKLIDKWQEVSDEMESKCNKSDHDRQMRQLRKGQTSNHEPVKEEEHIYNAAELNEMTYQRILESVKDDDDEEDDDENRGPRRKMFPYDMW